MSAYVERTTFLAAVKAVSSVIETRNTLPILDNIHVAADFGRIRLFGTDMDVEVSAMIAMDGETTIDTTVTAKKLAKLINEAPKGGLVDIGMAGDTLAVGFGKAKYKLPTLPAADMSLIESDEADYFAMAGADLLTYLERVKGAISTEETRYYLNGVFLHQTHEKRISFVATDGHRLHNQLVDAPERFPDFTKPEGDSNDRGGIIIPAKTVKVLISLLKGKACPKTVQIRARPAIRTPDEIRNNSFVPDRIEFSFQTDFGALTIHSKTIDGTFPDYTRVIPTQNGLLATFDVADIIDGLKATMVILEKRGYVKFEFGQVAGCKVVSHNRDSGERASYDLRSTFDFDALEVGCNAGYLLETVSLMESPLTIAFADASTPILLTSEGMEGFRAVVMPTRV